MGTKKSGLAGDVEWLNGLLSKRKVELDLGLSLCGDIDKTRRKDASAFCHVQHKPRLLCCSKLFPKQSQSRRRGLLVHEIGHALLVFKGDFTHNEHEADQEAERVLGVKVKYDKKGIQRI